MKNKFFRKLRKLASSPGEAFLDSKYVLRAATKIDSLNSANSYLASFSKKFNALVEKNLFRYLGDNWQTDKKIAVLFGFSAWKTKFIADYLKEYRVLYVNPVTPLEWLEKKLPNPKDLVFFIWAYPVANTPYKEFLKANKLPVIRVEDGFLRSVELGINHSVPYSLVFDKTGLYFNALASSDLEMLLNNYDFASSQELLKKSKELMELYCKLRLSKYNLPSSDTAVKLLGKKTKKRVLVIGQVLTDASIKYGCAANWDNEKLIALAMRENPESEIIYRSHPDLKNRKDALTPPKGVLCLNGEVNLAELFGQVDHVYVMTSLSGMEALLHGLKVTVVGMPFYAGWGLTDDRQICGRRKRKLTLAELFCGAYILYPRYLTTEEDSFEGCKSIMYRLNAERAKKSYKS